MLLLIDAVSTQQHGEHCWRASGVAYPAAARLIGTALWMTGVLQASLDAILALDDSDAAKAVRLREYAAMVRSATNGDAPATIFLPNPTQLVNQLQQARFLGAPRHGDGAENVRTAN